MFVFVYFQIEDSSDRVILVHDITEALDMLLLRKWPLKGEKEKLENIWKQPFCNFGAHRFSENFFSLCNSYFEVPFFLVYRDPLQTDFHCENETGVLYEDKILS